MNKHENDDEKSQSEVNIAESALGSIGVPEVSIARHFEDMSRKEYGRNVCVCGHPMSVHSKGETQFLCIASRLGCPCMNPTPVLEVGDKRLFLFKSEGFGLKHALVKGMYKSKLNNSMTRFIGEQTCFKCRTVKENLIPAGLDLNYKVVFWPAPYNGLFCISCLEELFGRPVSDFLW